MVIKKRIATLLLAAVMVISECVGAFAYGSKTAAATDGTEVSVEAGKATTVALATPAGTAKQFSVKADNAASAANVVYNLKALEAAIKAVASGSKKADLPVARQNGAKFKGYKVTINGKTKYVKKLTPAILTAMTAGDTVNITAAFIPKKFKVTIKATKNGSIKIPGVTYSKRSYGWPVDLTAYSNSIKNMMGAGYTLAGYSFTKGGSTVDVATDAKIYDLVDAKGAPLKGSNLKLYPVFKPVSGTATTK